MSDIDILQKALQQAVDNGWQFDPDTWSGNELNKRKSYKVTSLDFIRGVVYFGKGMQYNYAVPIIFIFRRDFAKAFWKPECIQGYSVKCDDGYSHYKQSREKNFPEKYYCPNCRKKLEIKTVYDDEYDWMYNLQAMVLEEEPLKYLEKFI